MKKCVCYILFVLHFPSVSAQKNCTVTNQTFTGNEQLYYKTYYSWGAIWLGAAEGSFNTQFLDVNGKTVYHIIGSGHTYPKYNWLYVVNDKYESYTDTSTLKPLRFIREVHEGSTHIHEDYVFNHRKNKVYSSSQKNEDATKLDSTAITPCTIDVMSAVFQVRCLDFSLYKINDTIPITFVLGGEVFPSYIRYLGKEVIKTELLGNVRCIKFRPKLIEGTLFKGGEGMTVWVTDDKNKMPVYVETPIIVGVIKVQLSKYSGLRNKIECIVTK